jgi:hypothetical protein
LLKRGKGKKGKAEGAERRKPPAAAFSWEQRTGFSWRSPVSWAQSRNEVKPAEQVQG